MSPRIKVVDVMHWIINFESQQIVTESPIGSPLETKVTEFEANFAKLNLKNKTLLYWNEIEFYI